MCAGKDSACPQEEDMEQMRRLAVVPIAMLILAACQGAALTNVVCVGEATTYLDWLNGDFQPDEPEPIEEPADTSGDLLEIIQERGTLIVSTDPNYEPQSFLEADGTFVGFDIDVATEIATRLGVEIAFETPEWDAITAGSWSERWDISVGSMTITTPRKEALSFTRPYYFTPASVAVAESAGIDDIADLPFELPEGGEATTLPTDSNCAEAIEAGREEFSLWVSSETTIDSAIERGLPLVKIPPEEPIFTENLAVAIDKSGPPHAALLFEIDRIIGEMHEDGTLTALSEEWFEADLTQDPVASQ